MFWDRTFGWRRVGRVETGVLDHQSSKPGTARDRKKERAQQSQNKPKKSCLPQVGGTCRRPVMLRLRVTAQSFQHRGVKLPMRGCRRIRRTVLTRRTARFSAAAGNYGGWRGRGGLRTVVFLRWCVFWSLGSFRGRGRLLNLC